MANLTGNTPPPLLPLAYLPPIWYFGLLYHSEFVVIESKETFPKQTLRNRCEIMTANGILALTIPVVKPDGNRTRTDRVLISENRSWQLQHWRAIESAYNSSPYFIYYKEELRPYFQQKKNKKLFDHNLELIELLCVLLDIKAVIRTNEEFEKKPEGLMDFRPLGSKESRHNLATAREYPQVFSEKHGFVPHLSIIDLLFNLGPDSGNYFK